MSFRTRLFLWRCEKSSNSGTLYGRFLTKISTKFCSKWLFSNSLNAFTVSSFSALLVLFFCLFFGIAVCLMPVSEHWRLCRRVHPLRATWHARDGRRAPGSGIDGNTPVRRVEYLGGELLGGWMECIRRYMVGYSSLYDPDGGWRWRLHLG